MADENTITWSLVTLTGKIVGRVGVARDGMARFSVGSKASSFYTQCRRNEILNEEYLRNGTQVMVTGKLLSYYDKRQGKYLPIIRALSILAVSEEQLVPILRQFEIADDPGFELEPSGEFA